MHDGRGHMLFDGISFQAKWSTEGERFVVFSDIFVDFLGTDCGGK